MLSDPLFGHSKSAQARFHVKEPKAHRSCASGRKSNDGAFESMLHAAAQDTVFFLKTLKADCLSGEECSISAFMPKCHYKGKS